MSLQFSKVSSMPDCILDTYHNQVPKELLNFWKQQGLGYLLDGYLKVINP
ncbi:GAD-like domain-containing protein [Streptococcus parasuis]